MSRPERSRKLRVTHERGTTEGDSNLSPWRGQWQSENLSPTTHHLLNRDAQAFLHQALSTPCLNALVAAQGAWIEDTDGRRYLDFHGNSVHQIGYRHPDVVQAVVEQLSTLPFCPRRYTNVPSVELAEQLGAAVPGGSGKVLFAPGGASAVGIALKLARVATGRHKTVSMWDSFHGASLDTISIGGEGLFRKDIGPLLPGTEHVPPADPQRCPLGCNGTCNLSCANYLEYVLDREGDVAAVIAEPIRSTTAVSPPSGYWQRVREACDRNGTLLIFDEIPTGLGRAGALFAGELTGVRPDMTIIGKGLGGGIIPIAAVVAHEDLDVADDTAIGHYTHEKTPLGAVAALATLKVIERDGLVDRAKVVGQAFANRLRELADGNQDVVEIRGTGLLIGVEMREPGVAEMAMYSALKRGLSFKVSSGTVLTLTPPLNVTDEELDLAIDALRPSLEPKCK